MTCLFRLCWLSIYHIALADVILCAGQCKLLVHIVRCVFSYGTESSLWTSCNEMERKNELRVGSGLYGCITSHINHLFVLVLYVNLASPHLIVPILCSIFCLLHVVFVVVVMGLVIICLFVSVVESTIKLFKLIKFLWKNIISSPPFPILPRYMGKL